MPFVGAAGLVGPEHVHCRGGSIASHPYKKNNYPVATNIFYSSDGRAGGGQEGSRHRPMCYVETRPEAVATYGGRTLHQLREN